MVSVTLWGQFCEQIQDWLEKNKDVPVIIAVQWARIKEFNGARQVTNSMYATRLIMNAETPLFQNFVAALNPEELLSPSATASNGDLSFAGVPYVSVNELYDAEDNTIFCIVATVLKVDTDNGWFYPSCKRCSVKIKSDGKGFNCDRCFQFYSSCVNR